MSSSVPDNWSEEYVSKFFNLCVGGTPSRSHDSYWDASKTSPNIWLSIKDLQGKFVNESAEKISDLGVSKSSVKLLPAGTVVMSFKLSIGRTSITSVPLYTNEAIVGFIEKRPNTVDRDYLYYGLQSWDLLGEVDQAVMGATLNKDKMSRIVGLFPPLPEQKKIASILTSVDEVIENTQKQIDKLQDLKKATMNELLTKGIGHTEFKDSELGRIPKSWVVSKVSNHLQDMTSGWSPDCLTEPAINSQWGVLKTTAVTWDGFDVNENKALPRHLEGRSAISLKKGDVLVTRAGPIDRVGVVAFCSATYPRIMLSDKIIRIQSKSDELSGEFLSIWLSSHHAQRNIRAKMSGMAESQSNISQDILKSVPVPIPGISEQLKITAIIRALTQRICVANRYLQQTESLKKSLMQDLLTGTVRVTVN